MASCRTHNGVNENITTYGTGKTRVEGELSTWEEATDVDLRAGTGTDKTEVLEVYAEGGGGGLWDDYEVLNGATTDATHFRIIRPASGEGHSGIPKDDGSVAGFRSTTDAAMLLSAENYSQLQDLVGKLNYSSSNNRLVFGASHVGTVVVGCIAFDSTNGDTGVIRGFWCAAQSGIELYFINILAHNTELGFECHANGDEVRVYNSTFAENETYGIKANNSSNHFKNVCASGNTTADWNSDGNLNKTTCTAESAAPTYTDSGNDDFHLAAADTICKDNGTDLAADGNFAFDDDINDGVMGAGKAGETRSGTWDIGFDEYVAVGAVAPTGALYGPLVGPLGGPI